MTIQANYIELSIIEDLLELTSDDWEEIEEYEYAFV